MPNPSKPVAVLFDVDETLVHTGGAGARSWKAAFQKLYGIPADIGDHSSAGETDPQVARETFSSVIGHDPSDDELDRLYSQYLLHLADDILVSAEYRVLPGVDETLIALGKRACSSAWSPGPWRVRPGPSSFRPTSIGTSSSGPTVRTLRTGPS